MWLEVLLCHSTSHGLPDARTKDLKVHLQGSQGALNLSNDVETGKSG